MKLKNKIAVITGGSSGIGRETVKLFAKEGANVVFGDINEKLGKNLVEECQNNNIIFIKTDVTLINDVRNLIKTATDKFGRLDILFNNAGINSQKSIEDTTEEEWKRVIDINMTGVFLGCKYGIPEMLKTGGGSIINTGSTVGLVGSKEAFGYCATKGAVVNLTRQIAVDYSIKGIRANCICPGHTDTAFHNTTALNKEWLNKFGFRNTEEYLKAAVGNIPIGRLGKPIDIAKAVLFLASEDSSFITGITLVVDGGWLAKR